MNRVMGAALESEVVMAEGNDHERKSCGSITITTDGQLMVKDETRKRTALQVTYRRSQGFDGNVPSVRRIEM